MRATDIADYTVPFALIVDASFAEDAGSLEEELVKRASHSHLMLKEDNVASHCMLEETTR